MEILKFELTGTKPLLMHKDTLADPLNPITKAHKKLTGKRKKTDDDQIEIAKGEFLAGMHIDENGPYLPGVMIESCLIAGAKLSKLGTQIKRSLEVMNECCYLTYDGPRTVEKMWEAGMYDSRSVKIGQSKIMRYRPIFRQWSVTCEIMYDETSMDREQIISCMEAAGLYCGLGNYRPKFGKFSVKEL